ncbi:hypothetical protein N657DRAFT_625325 [Parathielavia appendiculata]|uniref:Heterokaryon incompatibility domain-containing protein n=1 Tax=Parathielavia appendiculata TaxID=2587402 RepID=A0AAN6TTX5_9PEZI|nr:hypothetical protein N657DRAFT_625325 [Parathielavia appendiculata]
MDKISDAFPYETFSEHDSIRLLVLEPAETPEAKLHGHVILINIRKREADIYTEYIADDPSPGGSIVLHGKPFALTASLDAALRGVRNASIACRVWADALCFNQANIAERNRQVRLMGSIYSLADHTVIYLGPLTPDAEWVLRNADENAGYWPSLPGQEREEDEGLSLSRLRDILDRPWGLPAPGSYRSWCWPATRWCSVAVCPRAGLDSTSFSL